MIAIDSNLLVYAHRPDSPWHKASYAMIKNLAEGRSTWAIPWPCVHEFFAIVTHARIYVPPTPLAIALAAIEAWLMSPGLILLSETSGYWAVLAGLVRSARIKGGQVHDARIAALCLLHGVTELWSTDRDFSRFPALKVVNPLVR